MGEKEADRRDSIFRFVGFISETRVFFFVIRNFGQVARDLLELWVICALLGVVLCNLYQILPSEYFCLRDKMIATLVPSQWSFQ